MPDSPDPVSILVVDDEEPIRNALKRYLAQQHYQVHTAGSAREALEQLSRHRIDLMLTDIRMPGTSGIDLMPQALELVPDLAILMLSAVNDATSAALCMQRGAMDYLTKPLELSDLSRAVERALKRRAAMVEHRDERQRLEGLSIATLEVLVNALEAKDPYMRGHSARVADLAATIAAHLGLTDDDVEHVRTAGRLHDLGKIGTREAVLDERGPLTPEEFEHVKQHVTIGVQILAPLEHLGLVIMAIKHHHERWDGNGYPDGLKGDAIPLAARILAAVEIYDALTTARPYQAKLGAEAANTRLAELAGSALDPAIVAALTAVVSQRRSLVFLQEDLPAE